MRRPLAVIAAVALVAALAGCTADPLAEQYASGSTQNYISGDGSVTTITAENRGDPVEFEGVTAEGDAVSSADYEGQVVVLNFWYAACPPCRVEAPDLEKLHLSLEGDGASFLGVNVRDQADTARTFETETGVTYPESSCLEAAKSYDDSALKAANACLAEACGGLSPCLAQSIPDVSLPR